MIRKRLVEVCESLSMLDPVEIERAVNILREAKKRNSFVWIMGNGGSAATASHFANDLLKMCKVKAVDISGMTPVTLAFGNDHGWERMFANTVLALANPDDVLVVISCSGNSPNILSVVSAVDKYCYRIALTGPDGKLSLMHNNACIRAMSDDITVQEDVHSIVCHEIAWSLKDG